MPINIPMPAGGPPPTMPVPNMVTPTNPMAGLEPSGLSQIGAALGQFPQQMQEAKLNQAQTDEAMAEADDKKLARIAQLAAANPRAASDPLTIKTVSGIFKRRGTAAPIKDDGTLDVAALTPGKAYNTLTQQEMQYFAQLPAEDRKLQMAGIVGVPPAFLEKEELAPPPTPATIKGLMDVLKGMIVKNESPKVIRGFIDATKKQAGRAGFDFEQLIKPDIEAAMQASSDASLAKLVETGIVHPQQMDALRKRMLDDTQSRFDTTMTERRRMDDARIEQINSQAKVNAARLAQSADRLALEQQRFQQYAANSASMINARNSTQVKQQIDAALKLRGQVVQQSDALLKDINDALLMNKAPDPAVLDAYKKAKDMGTDLESNIKTVNTAIAGLGAKAAANATALPVAPVGSNAAAPTKTITSEAAKRKQKEKGWTDAQLQAALKEHGYAIKD